MSTVSQSIPTPGAAAAAADPVPPPAKEEKKGNDEPIMAFPVLACQNMLQLLSHLPLDKLADEELAVLGQMRMQMKKFVADNQKKPE